MELMEESLGHFYLYIHSADLDFRKVSYQKCLDLQSKNIKIGVTRVVRQKKISTGMNRTV